MKRLYLVFILLGLTDLLSAQNVYTFNADSVKVTKNCDSSELIIENHTQAVPGFLFNTGRGRTIFKRGAIKLNDSMYLIGADTVNVPKISSTAWIQGGNSWGKAGILGTLDNNNLNFYTNGFQKASLTTTGAFLLAGANDDGYFKLNVQAPGRFFSNNSNAALRADAGDPYFIQLIPNYSTIPGSVITWGALYAYIGVPKVDNGVIPQGSLVIGGTVQNRLTAIVDNSSNPTFQVNGFGQVTINGGYNGISSGNVGVTADKSSWDFNIKGGLGTGAGTPGDIIFSTGNSQSSGTTIHTMTNRWWLKGGTGYLSNTSTPTSSVDVTGTNGYSQFRMRTTYTPTSTSDTNGNVGDFSWDSNYLYIKTSGGWKRAALTTF